MIDGHAHLHQVNTFGRDKSTVELATDYLKQLSDAGIQKGIVIIRPYELGMYSDRAMRELAKWTVVGVGTVTPGYFNEDIYRRFLEAQEAAYKQREELKSHVSDNPILIKLLRSDGLNYLMEHEENECEDVLRKAKEMGFAGIKLWRTSGLLEYDDRVIKRAIELGMGKVQFHIHHSYAASQFLKGADGISLLGIAKQIIQEGGSLYLVHGAYLPLELDYMEAMGSLTPLENLFSISRHGIWLGTSNTPLSILNGTARESFLRIIDMFPQLQGRICFETDYPGPGATYKLPSILELETRADRLEYGRDALNALDKQISDTEDATTIKEVVEAMKTELNGLDSLQEALFNNAESFIDNSRIKS